jgi:Transglutaminase-like superfamily
VSALRRRAAQARRHLSSPADVLLLLRMSGWAAALPALKYVVPLRRLVRLAAAPVSGDRSAQREKRVADLARVLYRSDLAPLRDNCLERSLIAYRYLGRAHAKPELVVGMSKNGGDSLGHVWVLVDGRPLYDAPEKLGGFVPMVVFDPTGAAREP